MAAATIVILALNLRISLRQCYTAAEVSFFLIMLGHNNFEFSVHNLMLRKNVTLDLTYFAVSKFEISQSEAASTMLIS